MPKITTTLMFRGEAEEALGFYMSLFDDSRAIAIARYGPDDGGAEGTVAHATWQPGAERPGDNRATKPLIGCRALVAGATVYASGRTTRTQRSEYHRPEATEKTAELVAAAGGRGIALSMARPDSGHARVWQRASTPSRAASTCWRTLYGGRVVGWFARRWEGSRRF